MYIQEKYLLKLLLKSIIQLENKYKFQKTLTFNIFILFFQ